MTSPDTANTPPVEHETTLKLNGNGNHIETTTSLTTGGLAEPKGEIEMDGEDVVKDEEEEEGEEGEESEEEEEDDEEPSLKYERIAGAVPDLLKKDSASALAVSNKLLVISSSIIIAPHPTYIYILLQALGTHAGIIHILDITGKRIKSYKPHLASVVDISLDATADFVATASIDGGYFFIFVISFAI
jgi:vacuolar protein sorting-associated protein 41